MSTLRATAYARATASPPVMSVRARDSEERMVSPRTSISPLSRCSSPAPRAPTSPCRPVVPEATRAWARARAGRSAPEAETRRPPSTMPAARSAITALRIPKQGTGRSLGWLAGQPGSTIGFMEAGTRELSGEKAQRIIDAMRSSVGARGAAGATFDHVSREAGVSRGLLHYYFGTKERLLVEVVRRDCDIRMELIRAAMAQATSADQVIDGLVRSLEDLVEHDPGFIALVFEVFTSSRHNEDLAVE